jgi:membrane-bound ClpP family serine protease
VAQCVADKTDIAKADALRMIREGTNLAPDEAKKVRLIDAVADSPYPHNAGRSWQV